MANSIIIDSTGKVGVCTTVVGGAVLDVGEAGVTGGELRLAGSTSGNVKLAPNAVAGAGITQTLQAKTGTVALSTDVIAQTFVTNLASATLIAASTTKYAGMSMDDPQVTEADCQQYIDAACTLFNLRVNLRSAQPASGSLVLTVMKNGVASTVVVTIAAGGAAGWYSDTANTLALVAGDTISVRVVNNATANAGKVGAVQFSVR